MRVSCVVSGNKRERKMFQAFAHWFGVRAKQVGAAVSQNRELCVIVYVLTSRCRLPSCPESLMKLIIELEDYKENHSLQI